MSMSYFKTGDVVHLKSGGQSFSVEAIDGDAVKCVWVDRHGKTRRDCFPASCVQKGWFEDTRIGSLIFAEYSENGALVGRTDADQRMLDYDREYEREYGREARN